MIFEIPKIKSLAILKTITHYIKVKQFSKFALLN